MAWDTCPHTGVLSKTLAEIFPVEKKKHELFNKVSSVKRDTTRGRQLRNKNLHVRHFADHTLGIRYDTT
jgi:hypothetical protein